jgi:hypothetical protein
MPTTTLPTAPNGEVSSRDEGQLASEPALIESRETGTNLAIDCATLLLADPHPEFLSLEDDEWDV